ncbi:MAG: GlsB/YeaQ/YmgE family stress response membrane protein [Candidatus Dormibacteraeota bacterium]|nr:GlsB/YeaQ/YmgE family stress response membrane protein [Candidatus Dormibacteraeota bacterium]
MFLASVQLSPGFGFVGWIVIGLLAGAIAGRIVRGRGFGCLGNIIVGVIGAFLGGFLTSLVLPTTQQLGFWSSLVVAVIGAIILLAVVRLIFGRGR